MTDLETQNWGLPDQATITRCLEAARITMPRAHAPYSTWKVGAVLLAANGEIYTGCNMETLAYEAGLCAERAAIANAVSQGAANSGRQFVRMVAITMKKLASPNAQDIAETSPCGTCRQVMHDFSDPASCLIVQDDGANGLGFSLGSLLPQGFFLSINPRAPKPVDCKALEAAARADSTPAMLARLAHEMSGNAATHVNGQAEGAMIVAEDGRSYGGASVENSNTQLFIHALTSACVRGVLDGQSGKFVRKIAIALPAQSNRRHDLCTILNPSLLIEFACETTEITLLRGSDPLLTLQWGEVITAGLR